MINQRKNQGLEKKPKPKQYICKQILPKTTKKLKNKQNPKKYIHGK
jgi:hypothetical protein